MNRFFIAISGVVFAILVSGRIAFKSGWIITLPSFFYETTLLVACLTGVIFIYLFKSNNPSFFVQLYLLSMTVKLLACLGYNLFMMIEDRPGGVMNVLYFLFNYFVFTFLEIAFLYRKISDKR
ncbi:MAG: hypothetical protein ABIR06_13425 [Cyclobacteriaceae bacterium]